MKGIKGSRGQGFKKLRVRGFTFIEVVIVIVILSIVSSITIYFLAGSVKTFAMMVNQKSLSDEARLALERMCRDIRDARGILAPASGTSGNTIIFQRSHATFGDLAGETISFRLNGTNLEKVKTSPGTTIPLASNVSSFMVTRGIGGNDEITLSLTLSLGTGENATLETKVYPKNLTVNPAYKNFFNNWQEVIN